ncbi:MAG: site-2 protease family protein, partial [Clostridia bacterium]|nr:site-2 protease family protein [Clostridia bacterium]
IDTSVLPVFCLWIALSPTVPDAFFLWFLAAAILHECGHLTAARFLRIPIRRVRITPLGAVMEADFSHCSYAWEALLHGAGIITNMACTLILLRLRCKVGAAVSLLIGLYNLIPLPCFDGGRLLAAILSMTKFHTDTAEKFCRYTGIGFLACFYAAAVWIFLRGEGLTAGGMLLSVCALAVSIKKENRLTHLHTSAGRNAE